MSPHGTLALRVTHAVTTLGCGGVDLMSLVPAPAGGGTAFGFGTKSGMEFFRSSFRRPLPRRRPPPRAGGDADLGGGTAGGEDAGALRGDDGADAGEAGEAGGDGLPEPPRNAANIGFTAIASPLCGFFILDLLPSRRNMTTSCSS